MLPLLVLKAQVSVPTFKQSLFALALGVVRCIVFSGRRKQMRSALGVGCFAGKGTL